MAAEFGGFDHLIFSSVDKIIRGKLEDLELDEAKWLFVSDISEDYLLLAWFVGWETFVSRGNRDYSRIIRTCSWIRRTSSWIRVTSFKDI